MAATDESKLTHLEHVEDHHLNAGKAGYEHAAQTLHQTNNALSGRASDAHITTKYDGSPSVVFGTHPTTGKFFVASKSAFNKDPKLNYTDEDIEKNHGHAPGLVRKLQAALQHLPKVAPKKGVFQGDIMYSGDDVKTKGDNLEFTPNILTYQLHKHSEEGRKAAKAKLGMVVHTQYKGKGDLQNMVAHFKPDTKGFGSHSDVHIIDHNINPSHGTHDEKAQKAFESEMNKADAVAQRMQKSGAFDVLHHHTDAVKQYINKNVREGTKPHAAGFRSHVEGLYQKKIDSMKTEKGKSTHSGAMKSKLQQLDQHKEHIHNALQLHHHLQTAKGHLIKSLESATSMKTLHKGKPVKGEGFVVTLNGRPSKLVDREEFSRNNFNRDKE